MPVKNVHHVDLRIPRELWEKIKMKAEDENRSINSQIITMLKRRILDDYQGKERHNGEIE